MANTQTITSGTGGLAHYDRPVSKKNITGTNTGVGNVKMPLTDRQPLFSAINALFEKQRHNWLDLFKLPLFISVPGSSEPVSLLQLDNPVSKVEAMGILDGGPTMTALPTVWGATRTTTVTTIITAAPGDVVFLQFPTQTSPPALEYTTISEFADHPNSKVFPNGLPVLVLTQVNGIIVNQQNQTLTTVSTVQLAHQPLSSDTGSKKLKLVKPSSGWLHWSSAEKGGVIAAAVLAGLLLIGVFVCIFIMRRRSRKKGKDVEKGVKSGEKQRVRSGFGWHSFYPLFSAKRGTGKAVGSESGAAMAMDKLHRAVSSVISKGKRSGGGTALSSKHGEEHTTRPSSV
ncbi:MAG: hypothetical protein M1840_005320 [Geoglossum simile]|nr:MAG: hypothetical protein M1840_005320 [Geoglossum simile]